MPNSLSTSDYLKLIEPYRDEPVHKEMITGEMLGIAIQSYLKVGSVLATSGRWYGTYGECYIALDIHNLPIVAKDNDPIIFYRKQKAFWWLRDYINEHGMEVIEKITQDLKRMIE
jgi:hypothetical protein